MSLIAEIADGRIAPVYVLYGSEHTPMRAVVEALRRAVLDPATAAFNHERFVGRELEGPGRVLEACMQVPMLAAHRLVELDEPEAIGKGRGAANPKLIDGLIAYLASPLPSCVLVITSVGIDARSRFVTAAKKTGVVEKFEGLRRAEDAAGFVAEHARQAGIAIERAAISVLVERIGTSVSALISGLEQASLHAGGAPVRAADVAAVVADAREAVVFDLTDAVGMGKHERALAVLARIVAQADGAMSEVLPLQSMLARQLRLLMLAHGVGLRAGDLEARAGVPAFVARKLIDQARSFSPARLRRAFTALVRLDADLKGGSFVAGREPLLAVQRWILDACGVTVGVARRA